MTIEESINKSIEELISLLPQAGNAEAARIRTRIGELEKLKREYDTT